MLPIHEVLIRIIMQNVERMEKASSKKYLISYMVEHNQIKTCQSQKSLLLLITNEIEKMPII